MTSDEPPAPAGLPPEPRQRKAPTIDLTATEIRASAAQATGDGPPTESGQPSNNGSQDEEGASAAPSEKADNAPPRSAKWYNRTAIWAGIGAGVASGACFSLLFLVAKPFSDAPAVNISALDARLARLEGMPRDRSATPADLNQKTLDELASRIGKLEAAPARPSSDAAAANRLSSVEGELRALSESVGLLGRRSDDVASAVRDARQRADTAAGALTELTQKVTPSPAEASKKFEVELQNAISRLSALERAQKLTETELAKQERPENRDESGRLAVATTALYAAVERGQPFAPELAAVKSLARDNAPLVTLEPFAATGMPTASALARELSALVPSVLAAAGTPQGVGGLLEKLQANAEKLVRIRPLEEAQGSDPAAVVSRAEMKVSKGDLAGAVVELESLPAAARAQADAWIKKARGRFAAMEASRRLAADALAGLSK
jgi:hypothetical protein